MAEPPASAGSATPDPAPGDAQDGRTWLELYQAGEPDRPPPRWVVPGAVLLAGAACAVGGALTRGPAGAAAGPLAAVVVLAFFSSGALPLHLAAALGGSIGTGLGLLLLNYALRVAAALLALALAVEAGAHQGAVGLSVIACALVRVNVNVLVALRGRRSRTVRGT